MNDRTGQAGEDRVQVPPEQDTSAELPEIGMGLPQLLTNRQLAKLLEVSPRTLRQMKQRGQLFPARGSGPGRQQERWRSDDYILWLDWGRPSADEFTRRIAQQDAARTAAPTKAKAAKAAAGRQGGRK